MWRVLRMRTEKRNRMQKRGARVRRIIYTQSLRTSFCIFIRNIRINARNTFCKRDLILLCYSWLLCGVSYIFAQSLPPVISFTNAGLYTLELYRQFSGNCMDYRRSHFSCASTSENLGTTIWDQYDIQIFEVQHTMCAIISHDKIHAELRYERMTNILRTARPTRHFLAYKRCASSSCMVTLTEIFPLSRVLTFDSSSVLPGSANCIGYVWFSYHRP